ncbi:MAG TPA: hypothetical protein VF897_26475, partial [Roseiflexaceae bacterium]
MLPTIDLRGPRLDDYCFEEPHRAADATRRAYAPATSLIHDTLPRHRPAPIGPVDLGPRGAATLPARSAILVADDFEANRRTVARSLKMQGHAV